MVASLYAPLTPQQKEYKLQVKVVEQLPVWYPGLLFFHVPNRPGDATDGFFKKKMGAKAGASDLVFGWKNRAGVSFAGLIELKAPGEKERTNQNKFLSAFNSIGWKTAVCDSARDVWETLSGWGIAPASTGIQEPDTRTLDDKHKAAADFQKPILPEFKKDENFIKAGKGLDF